MWFGRLRDSERQNTQRALLMTDSNQRGSPLLWHPSHIGQHFTRRLSEHFYDVSHKSREY